MTATHTMLSIPARPAFTFARAQNNSGNGEASAITAPYLLGKYLVTNEQYRTFTSATGRKTPSYWTGGTYPAGKGDHPILFVSLTDAQAYCDWLNATQSTLKFRLPTEAEWENAARGPQDFTFPWGNSMDSAYSGGTLTGHSNYNAVCAAYYLKNFPARLATFTHADSTRYGQSAFISDILSVTASGSVSGWIDHATHTGFMYTDVYAELMAQGGFTSAVGTYPDGASAYGCLDMAGNAYEWTSSLVTASNGAEAGQTVNAVRGGSWYAVGRSGQAINRGEGRQASGAYATVGFRLAASLP